ncbi:prolipoprotein diacylglyceryl transferase [Undibacterium sp. RTI2.1]|uniref:prolipoprotein diacylglyceryl transferase n=1 Tax=unclassified Undibacterium TaxID=2630295 RepID=UPI002AB46BDC|nr:MULTISPECIES: prolipoprotein diacylglyceryl transferase [unclassified Undibacterium]MDY7536948.1 prolipoprotein diacylglyceryl transferase [Undibacterium sp. 5I1]MEB0032934.1 prolipoprotein diacylglyceryl transferase [Undibacterium sp. RTI2.1]MEB0117981.1 prolipoprotein diacylglyceryl transferase [Undibacterium sp. RTI2.2]MEB0229520.1 prolipoprotein diacylglyceryl transferase [Undibacterium sp. 10I3]MEB0258873.1 prolipoprotein diacylglyceryl transferase [Undibacterium sp. 5I1]
MLIHPNPDPVAFHLGPVSVHWYGLMYLVAFIQFVLLGRVRIRSPHIAAQGWKNEDIDDMLFYGVLGVVLGGRIGEFLFYRPSELISNPLEILMVWHGGMSFHGGFIGVLIAMFFWARKVGRPLVNVFDFIAPLVPLGYAAGRIGNFINHELPGRIASADLPWAMQWPGVDHLVHPSPIYQALVDGLLLFVILWIYARKARPPLAVGAMFVMLYGCARFFTEYFRTPDWQVNLAGMTISAGQILSLPMIIGGLVILVFVYRKSAKA